MTKTSESRAPLSQINLCLSPTLIRAKYRRFGEMSKNEGGDSNSLPITTYFMAGERDRPGNRPDRRSRRLADRIFPVEFLIDFAHLARDDGFPMAAPESPDHAGPHQGLWGARFGNLGAGRQNAIVCVVLVLAVWMVFGQTVRFGFVNYDDNLNVYDNGVVAQGLTPQSIPWAFSHPQTANWVPLTTLSHMLDCQIFGLNAAGHHFVNVLWHAAAAVLLFLILREMTGALWRSVFVAALFALHPLRAESVAWVSERKDVLSGFFFMLTIWAYLRYARRPSRGGYVAMAVIFTLGILSKSMLVTEPAVLLLLDYWPLGRLRGGREIFRLILEKTPLLVLALGSCVVSVMVPGLLITGTARLPLTARLANAAVSSVIYLRQMVWPAGLAVPYPVPPHGRPFSEIALATLLLAAITVLAVACRKKQRYLLVGWLWYLVMLIPVAGLVPISLWASHADRYTYLPEIGLAITGTWAFADLAAPWKDRQPILGAFMAIALGILMCCAARQSSYWRDSETLWDRSSSEGPDNAVAHCNLGSALAHKGETQPALRQYQMALRIDPHYSVAHCNLGNAFSRLGKIDEAIAEYRQALENNPDYAEAHCNLGNALVSTGKMEEAFTQFHRALASWPDYPQARVGLGSALAKIGRDTEAIAEYRKAWRLIRATRRRATISAALWPGKAPRRKPLGNSAPSWKSIPTMPRRTATWAWPWPSWGNGPPPWPNTTKLWKSNPDMRKPAATWPPRSPSQAKRKRPFLSTARRWNSIPARPISRTAWPGFSRPLPIPRCAMARRPLPWPKKPVKRATALIL